MNKEIFKKEYVEEFEKRLNKLKGSQKEIEFTKNVTKTNYEVLAIKSKKIKEIVNALKKTNAKTYLDLYLLNNLEEFFIFGGLLKYVDYKEYLEKYLEKVDCWAGVDCIKIKEKREKDLIKLSKKLVKSEKPFVRRGGVRLLFYDIKNEEVFKIIRTLKSEENYYVNMIVSWLLCESFIKNKEKTLKFLNRENVNEFVFFKTISKCLDSFRVSSEDKEKLKVARKEKTS